MKSQTDASVPPEAHDLITFEQVPNILPRRRGRKRHKSSVYRWADEGLEGVRLRYLQVAGQKCTTREWLMEFFAKITTKKRAIPRNGPSRRSVSRVNRTRRILGRSNLSSSQQDNQTPTSPSKHDERPSGGGS